jgi:hypothetical protein
MNIDVKMKNYEEKLRMKFTVEGFKEEWEKAFMSGNFEYKGGLKLLILNLLVLNKEVESLRAELQEIKNNPEEDLFLFILSLWIKDHSEQEITTRDLYNDLRALSEDKGLSFTLPDARALGVKIKQLEDELKQKYSLTSRTGTGNIRYYSFKEAGLE